MAALCRAIGISAHPPALECRRNESPAEADLPESTRRPVAVYLSEVYRRVAGRFPDVELGAIWPSATYIA